MTQNHRRVSDIRALTFIAEGVVRDPPLTVTSVLVSQGNNKLNDKHRNIEETDEEKKPKTEHKQHASPLHAL